MPTMGRSAPALRALHIKKRIGVRLMWIPDECYFRHGWREYVFPSTSKHFGRCSHSMRLPSGSIACATQLRLTPCLGEPLSESGGSPDGSRMEWEQRPKCFDVEGKTYSLHPCQK